LIETVCVQGHPCLLKGWIEQGGLPHVDVEEFRAAIEQLRAQARRAYNEQLEVERLLGERSKLLLEALHPKTNRDGPSNKGSRDDRNVSHHTDTDLR
jgi:hypothetical protein